MVCLQALRRHLEVLEMALSNSGWGTKLMPKTALNMVGVYTQSKHGDIKFRLLHLKLYIIVNHTLTSTI